MVDVVGAEACSNQFLEQIGLLIAALGGAETGQCIFAFFLHDFLETVGGKVQRLFPGRFAESAKGVGRVDGEIGRFRRICLADQRLGQAVLVLRIVETIAALDAEAAVVGRAVLAGDLDDVIVLDVIGQLAADTAIRADRIDGFVRNDQRRVLCRGQCAGGAGLHAFATGDAGGVAHRVAHVEHDFGVRTAECITDDVVDLFFAASAHATGALNTGIEVDGNGGVGEVGIRRHAWREARLFDAHLFRPVGQFVVRFVIGLALCTRHVGQQQFQHHLLRSHSTLAVAADFHVRLGRTAAGGGQYPFALDLDHT